MAAFIFVSIVALISGIGGSAAPFLAARVRDDSPDRRAKSIRQALIIIWTIVAAFIAIFALFTFLA